MSQLRTLPSLEASPAACAPAAPFSQKDPAASFSQKDPAALFPQKDDGYIKPRGNEIKRLRKQRGVSQELMTAKTGITLKTIRNLESNPVYRCRSTTINTLAAFFGVESCHLVEQEHIPRVRLLTSAKEVIEANIEIAASAETILACTGSRSHDERHLRQIEETLQARPDLVHYRVMNFPPFKQVFQEHLLRLLEIRNPQDRTQGYKTIHIGIYADLVRQPEYCICANETAAMFVLPPISGIIGEYNTGVLINDLALVKGCLTMIKHLYQSGNPLETKESIRLLGLVENGDVYD